jgi:trehalose 6-phosphate synthase/phosphatase
MGRTIIVSNRLPVNVSRNSEGKLSYRASAGGLATGLSSIYRQENNLWIGWPGTHLEVEEEKNSTTEELGLHNMLPVFLTPEEIHDYYEGFSNETLWPTFHYFIEYTMYNEDHWNTYVEVNKKFCEQVISVADPEDTIWVHDYHLLLLPEMLRQKLPDASIGLFLHIPFPSFEVFRLLPWRQQLLDGMLGSDLIGLHTYDDMRHFLSAVNRLRFLGNKRGQILKGTRSITVDSFPMGINYDKYASAAASPDTLSREVKYRTSLGDHKIMISIDRLDYSKGIPSRLKCFDSFLKQHPQYQGKVSFLMVVVPSRDSVDKYRHLKEDVDLLVGRINGKYGTVNWTPIHYFYRSFSLADLSAFYRMADVALVTPMRDGMNLVAKEYVASRLDKKGVLILSEMAGASKELSEAIIVNPNDKHQMVDAIHQALTMPEEQQQKSMELMQNTIQHYNIDHWVNLFLSRLSEIKKQQKALATRMLSEEGIERLVDDYQSSDKRILFLDYDGTLTNFTKNPEKAKPDDELLSLLRYLSEDEANEVVVISGRDKDSLENWLGHLNVHLICEHGVFRRKIGQNWETEHIDTSWKKEIRDNLEVYVNRTPGSFIEEKQYSLAWHFRRVEAGLGELRSREIISHLRYLTADRNLQVLDGNKVIEIKNIEVNKGTAAANLLDEFPSDFILAIGDDHTDEDTFRAMPGNAVTIKVGTLRSEALYSLPDVETVRELLGKMSRVKASHSS